MSLFVLLLGLAGVTVPTRIIDLLWRYWYLGLVPIIGGVALASWRAAPRFMRVAGQVLGMVGIAWSTFLITSVSLILVLFALSGGLTGP